MVDPRGIYEVHEDVARRLASRDEQAPDRPTGPVLVHAIRGFVDAGDTGDLVATHLLEAFESRRLVTFDVDQLLDYRSKRPAMTFDADRWSDYEEPALALDLLHDAEGTPFLLLHGSEPDLQWERFIAAVRQVVDRFGVSLTVGVHGVPMGVPHTRPIGITAHATRPDLVGEHVSWFGAVKVPASVSSLLELRLGEAGHDAMGFAVHVPHYLAQASYAPSAMVALEQIQRTTGLDLDSQRLAADALRAREDVARQIEQSEEIAAVVAALEQQYDAFTRSIGRQSLLAESASLPTAEELGEQFERFLAQQADDQG